ncbi:MAG: ATP-binding protein [Gammaproteobacteria bacterium]
MAPPYNSGTTRRLKGAPVHLERFSLSADEAALPGLLDTIARIVEQWGLAPELGFRLATVLEELFLNTVHHGIGDRGDARVHLSLSRAAGDLAVVYEDDGIPYDPFRAADRRVLDEPADGRRVGGLGVLLVEGLAARARYDRVGNTNRIELSFLCPR